MAEHAAPIMELRSVSVAYQGDIQILKGLSIQLRPNRITGIIGPNGAGNSTALKALYGLLKPTEGDVMLNGRPITGLAPWRYPGAGIALVPQGRSLFPDLSIEDNLKLSCWGFRGDRARVRRALDRCYEQFAFLKGRQKQRAGTLSGGQQRLLEVGRALVGDPKVLLLDEPTAMVAPKLATEIYDFILGLPARGISVLLVDQNVRQCVRVSDYLYVLELGQNKAEGSAELFRSDDALRELISDWVNYRIDA